ncbi:MAG: response regulator transcription factor [Hyphomicrobiaceae bacterium]
MTGQRIIIVDDHPLFRDALSLAISAALPGAEILGAGSLDELSERLDTDNNLDLVLLDLTMPGVKGLSGLLYLRAEHPQIPVVIVSATEDATTIHRCMDCGASGFVPKSVPEHEIKEAVLAVLAGELWVPQGLVSDRVDDKETSDIIARISTLTPQQIRVLMMLDDEGISNKLIAYRFGVKEATIKAHVSEILKKLDVDNRTQASNAFKKVSALDWQKAKA